MQTDSSTSSDRTEAESISTEDSCYGDSSVAWIKPQLQNQAPSRLRTQHIPGSPDLCRIPCCCGGPPSSTITTTDIPFKDPRTYVTEDVYPVLLISGQNHPQTDACSDIRPHLTDRVWMSHSLPSPQTTQVPEDPEWTRRRVVAVEQQQWNHYLAASAKAGQLVPQFDSFVLSGYTACHVEPKSSEGVSVPDIVSDTKQDNRTSACDNSTVPAPVGNGSLTSCLSIPSSALNGRNLTASSSTAGSEAKNTVSTAIRKFVSVEGEMASFVKAEGPKQPFVEWIIIPQDVSTDLQSVVHLLPKLDPSIGEVSNAADLKTSHTDDSVQQADSCPDFSLQRRHF